VARRALRRAVDERSGEDLMSYLRLIGAALLLAAFAALPAVDAWAQDKKKKDDKPAQKTADSDKMPAGDFYGILKSTPGSDRNFTIEVEQVRLVPAAGGARPPRTNPNTALGRVLQLQAQVAAAQNQYVAAKTVQAPTRR